MPKIVFGLLGDDFDVHISKIKYSRGCKVKKETHTKQETISELRLGIHVSFITQKH